MLSMRINTLVGVVVRQELVEKRGNDKALHFHFDLGMSYYVNGGDYGQRRGLHLLYYLKPGYGSVSVFSAITSSPFTKACEVGEWKHEITHDSEWRSISVFSDVYFDMAKKINQAMQERGLPEVPPITMNEHNSSAPFVSLYDWVDVEVTRPDPTDSYRRAVRVR